jgi:hypothetical protein
MSLYDPSAPIVRNTSLLADQQPGLTVNLFNEPTPDGLYGYRLGVLPKGFGRLPFSVAEVRVESKGIVDGKTRDFWATLPKCRASGVLPFKADYRYANGLHTTNLIKVPCPRYRR